jgi:hypothetical protein
MNMMVALLVSMTLALFSFTQAATPSTTKNGQVYFSPHGGCTEAVVQDQEVLPCAARTRG